MIRCGRASRRRRRGTCTSVARAPALYNWLFARQQGGEFLLRIEDTDIERNRPELTDNILDMLALARSGLGRRASSRQSDRLELYAEALAAASHATVARVPLRLHRRRRETAQRGGGRHAGVRRLLPRAAWPGARLRACASACPDDGATTFDDSSAARSPSTTTPSRTSCCCGRTPRRRSCSPTSSTTPTWDHPRGPRRGARQRHAEVPAVERRARARLPTRCSRTCRCS